MSCHVMACIPGVMALKTEDCLDTKLERNARAIREE